MMRMTVRAIWISSVLAFNIAPCTVAIAAEPLPFLIGRWVGTSGADITVPAERARVCKQQFSWMDISAERIAFGGPSTDAQSCLAPRWRKLDARTYEGVPRKCDPELDSLGDPAGPLRIVVLGSGTLSVNNSIHILCPGD